MEFRRGNSPEISSTPRSRVTAPNEHRLKVYLHNVSGISSAAQLTNFRAALFDCPYDVIVLVETWFHAGVASTELFDENQWLRYDRANTGDTRRGGGVLIAIRHGLIAEQFVVENECPVEQVWARLKLPGRSVYIGATYIPPNSTTSAHEQIVQSTKGVMEAADSSDYVLLMGDFNCPVEWLPDSENPMLLRFADGSDSQTEFLDAVASLGLSQVCDVRSRNQLELVFTDVDSDFTVSRASHLLKSDSHHHVAIECSFTIHSQQIQSEVQKAKYDFHKADLPGLSAALSSVNWSRELIDPNIDEKVARFYEIV